MIKKLCLTFSIVLMFFWLLTNIVFAQNNNEKEKVKTVEYNNRVIRLLLHKENKIINIDVDDYVAGVLVGEMYATSPQEALKAMAVAVRTYTLYMANENKNKLYDVTDDSSSYQAFVPRSGSNTEEYEIMDSVVEMTKDEVITYEDEIILALYHASSLNFTESCENVFLESLPYLSSMPTPFENVENAYFRSNIISYDALDVILEGNGFPPLSRENINIKIEVNDKGRCESIILTNSSSGIFIPKNKIRNMFGLRSNTFDIRVIDEGIEFLVYGYGHGVGLSQNGSIILAKEGYSYEEIIKKYYSNSEITKTIYK